MYDFEPAYVAFRPIGTYTAFRADVVLVESFVYTDRDGNWPVDAGATSDGASVPWFLWWFCAPIGRECMATFLHDDLIRNQHLNGLSRKVIDRKFREAMRACGTPQWKRNVLWFGVHMNSILKGRK